MFLALLCVYFFVNSIFHQMNALQERDGKKTAPGAALLEQVRASGVQLQAGLAEGTSGS